MERLTDREIAELAIRARGGDLAARNRIVEANMWLVRPIVRATLRRCSGFRDRVVGHEDLFQIASVALVGAATRYKGDRGAMFSTYARTCIRGALMNFLLWLREQMPLAADAAAYVMDGSPRADDQMADAESRRRIAEAFNELPDRDREIMIQRHGLRGGRRRSDRQIAAWMKMTIDDLRWEADQIERRLARKVG